MASSAAGSELFESYEQDFKQLYNSISQKINNVIPSQSGEERKVTLRAIDREIDEATEIFSQMDIEIVNMPSASRSRLQARLKNHKSDLEKLKRDVKAVASRAPGPTDREQLLSARNGTDLDSAAVDQRARLLMGTERLAESSLRLQESHRVALETETVGASVLDDLRRQREQILHTRNTLTEADSYIDKASRTLRTMSRRMATSRAITILIIIILVALILFVVYAKLFL